MIAKVRKEYLVKTYKIDNWETDEEFLEGLARKMGKLLKKGEPDLNAVARIVLNDLQRGKIPYYVAPKDFEIPLPSEQEPAEEPKPEEKKDEESTDPEAEKSEDGKGKENEPKPPTTIQVDQDFSKIKMAIEFDNPEDENPETVPAPKIDIDQVLNPEDMPDLEVAASDNESSDDEDVADSKNVAITAASGSFTVSAKRKMEETKNLSAKDRRAIERAQKRKKIGSNFYEVANVKNRNRDKAKPADIVKKRK